MCVRVLANRTDRTPFGATLGGAVGQVDVPYIRSRAVNRGAPMPMLMAANRQWWALQLFANSRLLGVALHTVMMPTSL